MTVELHLPDLPDLPEVEVALGGLAKAPRPQLNLADRIRQWLATFLPLLIMVGLVLGSWWLVKQVPHGNSDHPELEVRHDPDYAMENFVTRRYDPAGHLQLQLEGRQLKHFPDTDALEIEVVQAHWYAEDGSMSTATANQATVSGDGKQIVLQGQVHVAVPGALGQDDIHLEAEKLLVQVSQRHLSTEQPAKVTQGVNQMTASNGLDYDDLSKQLVLHGQFRAHWQVTPSRH